MMPAGWCKVPIAFGKHDPAAGTLVVHSAVGKPNCNTPQGRKLLSARYLLHSFMQKPNITGCAYKCLRQLLHECGREGQRFYLWSCFWS